MRVVADHSRAAAFLIADGVTPSNEGRGYVLRRIMRRAVRHGDRLGLKTAFFDQTVDTVIAQMGGVFPELKEKREFVLEATRHEEDSFRRTLDKGLKMIDEETARLKQSGGQTLSGEAVFFLHDTHGFPWDLTEVIAKERGFGVDVEGFQKLMEKQREQGTFHGSGEKAVGDLFLTLSGKLKATKFLGYEGEGIGGEGTVLALVKGGQEVPSAKAGDEVELVLDQTPFYAESGGQVGDTGKLSGGGAELEVLDTTKPVPTLHVHRANLTSGELKVGDEARARGRRRAPQRDPRQSLRHPPAPPRAAAGAGRAGASSAARWWRPTTCASTTRAFRRRPPSSSRWSRTWSTSGSARTPARRRS